MCFFGVSVDAVYAAAHAIHNLIEEECGQPFHLCEALRPAPLGPQVLKSIRNVTFTGMSIKTFTTFSNV